MHVARTAVVIVHIVRKDHRVAAEHLAVLQDPLATVTQNCSEICQCLIREGKLHGVLIHLTSLIHLLHHIKHNGVPEKAAIFVFVQFTFFCRRLYALLGSCRFCNLFGVTGQDRN